jgi:hypothetical protein
MARRIANLKIMPTEKRDDFINGLATTIHYHSSCIISKNNMLADREEITQYIESRLNNSSFYLLIALNIMRLFDNTLHFKEDTNTEIAAILAHSRIEVLGKQEALQRILKHITENRKAILIHVGKEDFASILSICKILGIKRDEYRGTFQLKEQRMVYTSKPIRPAGQRT